MAVVGGWTHAIGLYVISTSILLTSSFMPLIYEASRVHEFLDEMLSICAAILMVLARGISMGLQYFSLLAASQPKVVKGKTVVTTRSWLQ